MTRCVQACVHMGGWAGGRGVLGRTGVCGLLGAGECLRWGATCSFRHRACAGTPVCPVSAAVVATRAQVERLAMAQRARELITSNFTLAVNMEAYRRFYSWIMSSPDVKSTLDRVL